MKPYLSTQMTNAFIAFQEGWKVLRLEGLGQIQFWFIALAIGIFAGFTALFFRKGIDALQSFLYGTDDVQIPTQLYRIPLLVLDPYNPSNWRASGWPDPS